MYLFYLNILKLISGNAKIRFQSFLVLFLRTWHTWGYFCAICIFLFAKKVIVNLLSVQFWKM